MDSVLTHLVRVVVHQSLGFLQKLIEAFKSSHIQAGSIYKSGCGASRSLRAATLTEKIVVAQKKKKPWNQQQQADDTRNSLDYYCVIMRLPP